MSKFVEAAQNGDLNEVKRLLSINPEIINEYDGEHDTAIMKACRNCNGKDVVAFLLENGANINDKEYRDLIDQSPLIIAAFNGCTDIVRMLLDAGADIGHRNDQGENALISASQEGNIDVVKVLLDAGADKNQPNADGETPLELAIRLKQKKELINLLKGGKRRRKTKKRRLHKRRRTYKRK
jgi:ankyrin repeat protein